LALKGWAFRSDWLSAIGPAARRCTALFIASIAASIAYLVDSKVCALEMLGLAISIFHAISNGTGGFITPFLFGWRINNGDRGSLPAGYGLGAALAIFAGLLAQRHAVHAERKSLEEVARLG
jgi:hypothetical protein